jgi:hypothetical protein
MSVIPGKEYGLRTYLFKVSKMQENAIFLKFPHLYQTATAI